MRVERSAGQVAFLAHDEPAPHAISAPAAADADVVAQAPSAAVSPAFPQTPFLPLQQSLEHVRSHNDRGVTMRELVTRCLTGLEIADSRLQVVVEERTARVLFQGKPVERHLVPGDQESPEAWAMFVQRVVDSARAASPRLREHLPVATLSTLFAPLPAMFDKYSVYMPPSGKGDYLASRQFYGIGAVLDDDGVITATLPGGVAHRVGLRNGDRILAVDGVRVRNRAHAVEMLRGEASTDVSLSVESRSGARQLRLRRVAIATDSVSMATHGDVAHVRITSFEVGTGNALRAAVEQLRGEGITKIILDLRGNHGGRIDEAGVVADQFLAAGRVVELRGVRPQFPHIDARPGDAGEGAALVVLVDSVSASSSEVVAAALQDTGRAVVMGPRTFGKGIGQSFISLGDMGTIKVTNVRLFAPSGATTHEQGVTPALCTSRPGGSRATLEELRRGNLPRVADLTPLRQRAASVSTALDELHALCVRSSAPDPGVVDSAMTLLRDRELFQRALELTRPTPNR